MLKGPKKITINYFTLKDLEGLKTGNLLAEDAEHGIVAELVKLVEDGVPVFATVEGEGDYQLSVIEGRLGISGS